MAVIKSYFSVGAAFSWAHPLQLRRAAYLCVIASRVSLRKRVVESAVGFTFYCGIVHRDVCQTNQDSYLIGLIVPSTVRFIASFWFNRAAPLNSRVVLDSFDQFDRDTTFHIGISYRDSTVVDENVLFDQENTFGNSRKIHLSVYAYENIAVNTRCMCLQCGKVYIECIGKFFPCFQTRTTETSLTLNIEFRHGKAIRCIHCCMYTEPAFRSIRSIRYLCECFCYLCAVIVHSNYTSMRAH